MATIVGGISVSHAPGITGWPDAPKDDEKKAVFEAFARLRDFVAEAKPDIVIAFLDDHFDNHFRKLMPAISVGISETHRGPHSQYFELLNMTEPSEFDGAPALAEGLLSDLLASDFDVARMGPADFGNNLMVPVQMIRPEADFALIPVFINVFTPPLISMRRAYSLGQAIRSAVEVWDKKVLFMGTGGLSHWPPVWAPERESDDFLDRMAKFQEEGPAVLAEDPQIRADVGPYEIRMAEELGDAVVNPVWDEKFLELLCSGNVDALKSMTYEEIEQGGGHGGHEILNWMAVAGAMGGVPGEKLVYAPTPEWICGTGAVLYEKQ